MDRDKFSKTVLELEARVAEYERILRVKALDRCSFIVQVGPMTLTTNEQSEVVPQLARFPTQFSEKGVRIIMGMTFLNGRDEVVKAKVFGVREWYTSELNKIRGLIDELRSQ